MKITSYILIFLSCILMAAAFSIKIVPSSVYPLTRVLLTPLKSNVFSISEDFYVRVEDEIIKIPNGFTTNLASVPRILWNIFPPQEYVFIEPAILHDYLYTCHKGYTRERADEILYSFLLYNQVPKFTARLFYLGVRAFGSVYYNAPTMNDPICKI